MPWPPSDHVHPPFYSSFLTFVLFKTKFAWIKVDFGISGSARGAFSVGGWIRGLPDRKRGTIRGERGFWGGEVIF